MWGIIGVVCLLTLLFCLYVWKKPPRFELEEKEQYSYRQLCHVTQEMLNNYIRESEKAASISADALRNKEEQRRELSDCIRNCNSGNIGAREVVKELIRDYLSNQQRIDESRILYAVPFHSPDLMSSYQLMECLLYDADKARKNYGLRKLYEENLIQHQNGDSINEQEGAQNGDSKNEHGGTQNGGKKDSRHDFIITEQKIRDIYNSIQPTLSYADCLNILVQMLFADTIGLGVIDSLNYQQGFIEEIQLGMNGLAEQSYDYRDEMNHNTQIRYSKDSVHVLIKGNLYWLPFLSFRTEEELQRVLRNLIKDSRTGELTRIQPMTVVDTVDGRRISVSRPPMTDTWIGLIRKFDSVTQLTIRDLYQDFVQGAMVINVLTRLIQSGRNLAITGEMASGKTTLLRACVTELQDKQSIRVIESESFELKLREFLPTGNSLTMRVSKQTPAEDVLAFARKTTGQVFVVGEVNSASIASMVIDLSKISSQVLFSAHYTSTSEMITDFVNAKLCVGGYSDERLAEQDVVRAMGYDIHLANRNGTRYIEYINEIVLSSSTNTNQNYQIVPILQFVEEENRYLIYDK